jgi:endosialidase-like protein
VTAAVFKRQARIVAFIASVLLNLMATPAFAACSTPSGNEGDINYVSGLHVMVYCNGTSWIGMGVSQPVSFGSLTNGDFCLATSGTAISCTTQFVNLASQVTNTLPTTNGGTGLAAYTTGDMLYASATNVLSKLSIGTTGWVLTASPSGPTWSASVASSVSSFSAGTTGFTPASATTGAVTLAGTLAVGNGGTGTATALTKGSVVIAGTSGVYTQDNANFFYDATNHRLGIGTATPTQGLTVFGNVDVSGTNGYLTEVANAGTTGTTVNKLAKLNTSGAAIISATADIDGMLGIVVSETAGGTTAVTTGNAQIATSGQASCVFDGQTVPGDYVSISATVAGDCLDGGTSRPLTNQTIGRVLTANSGVGTTATVALALNGSGTGGVPTGTIMAFAGTCPAGWTEYTAARGRFLRGIDNGAGIDPSGTRAAGSTQADAFQGHYHSESGTFMSPSPGGAGSSTGGAAVFSAPVIGAPTSDGTNGTPRTATETRPVNVAVTFCQYQGGSPVTTTASGATNYVARWTSATTIGTGTMYDSGSAVGLNTASPQNLLDVNGAASIGYNVAAPTNGLIVAGNIGVGTTSPWSSISGAAASLDLSSSGTSRMTLHDTATTQEARISNSGTGLFLTVAGAATASNNLIAFYTDNANSDTSTLTQDMVITSAGNVGIGSTTPGAALTVAGVEALNFAADYSTTGSQNNVNLTATSSVRYTGSSAATFTGIITGTSNVPGSILHLHNASSSTLTLANQSASSTITNEIMTGTGAALVMAANSSVIMQYDGSAALWRVIGGSGGGIPAGTTGQVQFNSGANAFAANTNLTWDNTNFRLGIGSATPTVGLDLSQKTDALALPVGTSGQRPTCSAGSNGILRYNSTIPAVEACVNGAWVSVGAGGGQLLGVYASGTAVTNNQVVFTGAAGSAPSYSGGVLTLASNTAYVVVELWGAGGGGSGGGASPTSGTAGSTSCFGTNSTACTTPAFSATGGGGGVQTGGAAAGSGTAGTLAPDIMLTGQGAAGHTDPEGATNYTSGTIGGSAPRGGGGGKTAYSIAGAAGSPYGGGGGGGGVSGGGTSQANGAGGGGGGYASKFISSPSGTYYFTVGAGGSGGAAGAGTATVGGAGGAGGITVTAYSSGSTQAFNIATQATGTLGVANGGTGDTSPLTQGSVVFAGASGVYTQDNANFFYDATNHRLGIGTTGPVRLLNVAGNGAGAVDIELTDTSQGTNLKNFIIDNRSQIFGIGTDSDAGNNYVQMLAITRAGNVGIGATNPLYNLVVANGGHEGMEFGAGYISGRNFLQNYNRNTSAYVQFDQVASLYTWQINGTEKMRLDASGNLGIGTTAPGGVFEVQKNATYNSDPAAALRLSNATTPSKMIAAGYDGTVNAGYIQSLQSGGSYQNLLLNPNGGNVGIGTTAPSGLLNIFGSGGDRNTSLNVNTNRAGIVLQSSGGGGGNFNIWSTLTGEAPGGGALAIFDQVAATFRMVINSAGNVGIGTTAPAAWGSSYSALQLNSSFAIVGGGYPTNSYGDFLAENAYFNGSSWLYMSTEPAGVLSMNGGAVNFRTAASGTAGSAISWTTLFSGNTSGNFGIGALAASTSNTLCYNTSTISGVNTLAACSSLRKYKKEIAPLDNVFPEIGQLSPVSYTSTTSHRREIGFIAEEVEGVDPRISTYDGDRKLIGVQYDHITALLVAGLKELKTQFDVDHEDIAKLKANNDNLRASNDNEAAQIKALTARLDALENRH